MTNLTQTQWNVLTYIQHFEARHTRNPRNSDIQAGCGLESRAKTKDMLSYLEAKGLVQRISKRVNGSNVLYARSNPNATGSIGIVFEDAKEVTA